MVIVMMRYESLKVHVLLFEYVMIYSNEHK